MEKFLLIDFNNVLYRAAFSHKSLSFKGKNTGGVFGFMSMLSSYLNEHQPDVVAIGTDTYPLIKKKLFPEYKSDRKKPDEDVFNYLKESRKYTTELIKLIGVPFIEIEGFEFDDIAYSYTTLLSGIYSDDPVSTCKLIICSNDDDLFQLLRENIILHRNKGIYTIRDFEMEYGISPYKWEIVQCLSGNHNNVPNLYKGLGIKTALKIVKDDNLLDKVIQDNKEQYDKNERLVELYAPAVPKINNICMSQFSIRKLQNWLITEFGVQWNSSFDDAMRILGGK